MTTASSEEKMRLLAKQLRTVGDEGRLRILCTLITHTRACVSDIAGRTEMTVATTSHHLQVLVRERVLIAEREGKHKYYSLSHESFIRDLKRHICKYR
ncbi:MAG: metalloregulator ArsR/SmtB family transcription factor [Minisyncoccia bacterium]